MKTVLADLEVFAINIMLIMFVLAGYDKATNFNRTVVALSKHFDKLNFSPSRTIIKLLVLLAIFIETVGPFAINYGITFKKYDFIVYATYTLIIYMIVATFLYFYPPFNENFYPFISALTTVGGLIMIIADIKYS
tara:strand:- start:200 stop:604 length:405 start_codon:yes stop_codon:yes gene_type:complete